MTLSLSLSLTYLHDTFSHKQSLLQGDSGYKRWCHARQNFMSDLKAYKENSVYFHLSTIYD